MCVGGCTPARAGAPMQGRTRLQNTPPLYPVADTTRFHPDVISYKPDGQKPVTNKRNDMDNEKVQQAIKLIRSICQTHNVALAFSSGKDSVVLDYLAKEANVKVERFHNVTTIDPEGTIKMAEKYGCTISRNKLSFLDLVEKKGFPTQFRRFCCKELKEKYYADYVLFGIRKDESVKRSSCYADVEDIYYYTKKVFTCRYFPMLHFTNQDIEDIVNEKGLECHPLYYDHNGKFCVDRRLGCIGCPLQGDRGKMDFLAYPILLKQLLRRGILFHRRQGRNEDDAALNLVYNLFYSNHGYKKFEQTYKGLFDTDPWEILSNYFFLDKEDVMRLLPKPKF